MQKKTFTSSLKKRFVHCVFFFLLSVNLFGQSPWTWDPISTMPFPRPLSVGATFNNNIYVYGGNETLVQHQTSNKLSIYNPSIDSWMEGPNAPSGRWGHAFLTVGNKIFALGGEGPTAGSWNSQVAVYDPVGNSWSTRNNWATPRNSMAAGVINGKVYLAGGRPGYGKTYATNEEYDPGNDSWTIKAPMLRDRYPNASTVCGGKLYAIGGVSKTSESDVQFLKSVEAYNPITDSWDYKAELPMTLFRALAVTRGQYIYVLALPLGYPDLYYTHILRYDSQSNHWDILSSSESLLEEGALTQLNEKFYYMGGWLNGQPCGNSFVANEQPSNGNPIPCKDITTVNYSGKNYNTVKVGTQCWLKENLDIGNMILVNQNPNNNNTVEKYCYNNDLNNCNLYGGLYQWNEAMQYVTNSPKGICPTGWHIPSSAEYQQLISAANNDGNALKTIGQGSGNGSGTNTTGFSALLSGTRDYDGKFTSPSVGLATFWTSNQDVMGLNSIDNSIYFGGLSSANGYFIRCLSDIPVPLNSNPVAKAGEDQAHDCAGINGKLVTLHGENSYDPDNDPLTYSWNENSIQIATGVTTQVLLSDGVHTITLNINDGKGGTSSDEVVISINVDNIAPVITAPSPITVYANVSGGYSGSIGYATAIDNCDSSPIITNDALQIFPLGTTKVTWTATDHNGNYSPAEQLVTVEPYTMVIDIKPGSDDNPINLKSKGVIPIAILTVNNFDASNVDVSSLKFGPKGTPAVKSNLEDVDKDGYLDLILHFDTQLIGLTRNSTSAVLVGKTKLGVEIKGTDKVYIVPSLKKEGSENEIENIIPTEFLITQNFPNPFNPTTVISYHLPVSCFVTLKVYNTQGREVSILVNAEKPAGIYNITFDGNNLPSGIYFYKLQAGNFVDIKKMVLVK